MNAQIDVRAVLPAISAPSLIMHRTGDRTLRRRGQAATSPGRSARAFLELPGDDHLPWTSDPEPVLNEIEEFLTGAKHVEEPDRVLATVMFADIAGSTERAAAVGDRALAFAAAGLLRRSARRTRAPTAPRDRHRGRRLLRHLRRAGARRALRAGDHPRCAAPWP